MSIETRTTKSCPAGPTRQSGQGKHRWRGEHSVDDLSRRSVWSQFQIRVDAEPVSLDRRIIAWLRASWAWLTSLGVHAAVTLLLMVWTTSSAPPQADMVYLTATQRTRNDSIQPIRLEAANFGQLKRTAVAQGSPLANGHAFHATAPVVNGPILGSDSGGQGSGVGAGPTDEARSLLQNRDHLLQEIGATSPGTQFFGIQAEGNRFVFVVDSSGSMKWAKWRRACRELVASVENLGPHQSFCVFFFDSSPHLMFNQRPAELGLISATPHNVRRLRRWMASINFGNDTRPYAAVRYALSLRPDAVFLLSDGEFQDATLAYLRSLDGGDAVGADAATVVHTIGFMSRRGQTTLQEIADETGGKYRFVP